MFARDGVQSPNVFVFMESERIGWETGCSSISVLPEVFTFQREMEMAGILVFHVRVHVFVYDLLLHWKSLLGQPVLPASHSVQRRILMDREDST